MESLSLAPNPLQLAFPSPPWSVLGREIESMIRKAIFDFSLFGEEEQKLAIALSGGKDSLTLLHFLSALRGRGFPHFELFAIHVGGAFSCGAGISQPMIQHICQKLNVTFIPIDAPPLKGRLECYSCSRQRRKILFDAAKQVGATKIAFGHHQDDSAQTLLMNLLHKAEFAAMLPKIFMRHYDITIIRPLMYVPEAKILSFAKEAGFFRITCQCPVGARSKRKTVDQWMQRLESDFPHLRRNLAQAALHYGSQKADLDP